MAIFQRILRIKLITKIIYKEMKLILYNMVKKGTGFLVLIFLQFIKKKKNTKTKTKKWTVNLSREWQINALKVFHLGFFHSNDNKSFLKKKFLLAAVYIDGITFGQTWKGIYNITFRFQVRLKLIILYLTFNSCQKYIVINNARAM